MATGTIIQSLKRQIIANLANPRECLAIRSQLPMKCPSCNRNVGLFNPALRHRKCPHCGAPVRQVLPHKAAYLLGLGVGLIPVIIAPAFSGLREHLLIMAGQACVAVVGFVALTRFELRTAEA
jgi:hypothetical protein